MSASPKESSPPTDAPLTMSPEARKYGHVPGYSFGATFSSRKELMTTGVHGLLRAGIHGDSSNNGGAFSICLNGGYEDDEDLGDNIVYVGCGGQDQKTGEQIADQSINDPGNKALYVSYKKRKPVRVIRGSEGTSIYAPRRGFRYDGLYYVDSYATKEGKGGRKMCFFELSRKIEEGDGYLPLRRHFT